MHRADPRETARRRDAAPRRRSGGTENKNRAVLSDQASYGPNDFYLRGAATLAFQAYQYQRRLEEGDDSLNLDFNTGSKARA